MSPSLADAMQSVPPGGWAIGVSGGADSIALLTLLVHRPDLSLHVVHLNHETRGQGERRRFWVCGRTGDASGPALHDRAPIGDGTIAPRICRAIHRLAIAECESRSSVEWSRITNSTVCYSRITQTIRPKPCCIACCAARAHGVWRQCRQTA